MHRMRSLQTSSVFRASRRAAVLTSLVALLLPIGNMLPASAASSDPILRPSEPVPGSYIVTFKDIEPSGVGSAALDLATRFGGVLGHVYTGAIRGFSIRTSEQAARSIAALPAVERVEQDGVVRAVATQTSPPWGLDRIDQRDLPLNNAYTYTATGSGVRAYIIDTGIRATHNDFGGRASIGTDTIGDGRNGSDCNGHGTHVAGTTGGTAYGVAKQVSLVAVRVLDCGGSGTFAGVIAGVDWVTNNRILPAVANMSLAGGASTTLDNAVRNSIAAGVVYAVAASNDADNACFYSPARTPEAITVGATNSSDTRASFSNFGTCVDLFAPGVSITSAWHTSNTATATISGTSMASPHVAGAVALLLQGSPGASPATIAAALLGAATPGKVIDPGPGSPNLLLFAGAGAAVTAAPASLSFGSVGTGTTSAPLTVTVTNGTTDPVTFGAAGITGTHAGDFALSTDTCSGGVVAAGGTCAASVVFTPAAGGGRSAALSLPHDATGSPLSIPLSGSGVAPQPGRTLSVTSLALGSVKTGAQTLSKAVTVTSSGTAPLTIGTLTLGGTAPSHFLIASDECSGASLAPGLTCRVTMRAAPTTFGSKSASLSIPTNAGGASVSLSTSGISTVYSVSPMPVSLGTQAVGAAVGAASSQTIRLTNVASSSLSVTNVSIGGLDPAHFALTANACSGRSLPRTAFCEIEITFAPTSGGFKDSGAVFATNRGQIGAPAAGIGTTDPEPQAGLSSSSLTFGSTPPGSTADTQTLTVTNTGTANLVVGTVTIGGSAEFGKPSDTCSGATVAPAATCAVGVNFSPVTEGTKNATLSIPSNAAGSPHAVALSGVSAAPAPAVGLSTSALSFGSVAPGSTAPTQTLTVTNTGTANLVVGSVTLGGSNAAEFGKPSDTCSGATVAPAATCTVGVNFAPVTTGAKTAAVSIPSNAAGSPHAVALSGTGAEPTSPAVSLSPSSLAFGTTFLGWPVAAKTVTVTNSGDGTLTVGAVTIVGPNASEFQVSSNTCTGASVAPGASCSIGVRLAVTSRGAKSATLMIASNAATSPDSVPMSANVF